MNDALKDKSQLLQELAAARRQIAALQEQQASDEQQHHMLQALLNNLPDIVVFKDRDSIYRVCNRAYARYRKTSPDELVGRSDFDIWPREEAERYRQEEIEVMESGQVRSFEHAIDTPWGKRLLEAVKAPLRDEDGHIVGVLCSERDVTEQRQMEEEVWRSQRALSRAQEIAQIGNWEWDIPSGQVTWSDELYFIFGLNRQPISFNLVRSMIHPEDRDSWENAGQAALNENVPFRIDCRIIRPDGSVCWIHHESEVKRDAAGQPLSMFGTTQDITERKRAEQALRESEQHYRTLFESAGDGIFIHDLTTGLLREANQLACDRLGYTREEMLQMGPKDIVRQTHTASVEEHIREIKEKGQLIFETVHVRRDGKEIPVELNTRLVEYQGQPAILAVVRDVSERKKLEEQLRQAQKMEAIGQLAGGVAHDFNNILTAIMGHTDFLLGDLDVNDPRREDAANIQYATERASALTRQLLAFSRRQILQPKILNLNDTIANLSKMLQRLISEDIELVITLDPDVSQIRIDPGQIEQVIMNLVVNAREAIPRSGTVTIETGEADVGVDMPCLCGMVQPGRYVRLTIRDTGHGMDAETREHIFEPFFTTKETGTGLGLAMVYGIVSQSQGHVAVDSEPGVGTAFNIYLPMAQQEVAAVEETALPTQTADDGSETILVVEDAEQVLKLACRVLRHGGYNVLAATYGDEALRLCQTHKGRIDLLLTDLVMPGGISGRDLAEQLLSCRGDIRVLYMSGHTDDTILRYGIAEERIAFLQKPFTAAGLLNKVREVLDKE